MHQTFHFNFCDYNAYECRFIIKLHYDVDCCPAIKKLVCHFWVQFRNLFFIFILFLLFYFILNILGKLTASSKYAYYKLVLRNSLSKEFWLIGRAKSKLTSFHSALSCNVIKVFTSSLEMLLKVKLVRLGVRFLYRNHKSSRCVTESEKTNKSTS